MAFINSSIESIGIFYFIFVTLCQFFLQTKVPSVKSIISKASDAKADLFVESGDKIHFGDLFLEVGMQRFMM